MRDEAGFTLIEIICVLAIVAMLAALAMPAAPSGTSQTRLAGYATEIAALLKGDRYAAIRARAAVATALDADARTISSGAGQRTIHLPADVAFNAVLADRCAGRKAGKTIDFFPNGGSCGGAILLARQGQGFQIRVNWLTGGVEIAALDKS